MRNKSLFTRTANFLRKSVSALGLALILFGAVFTYSIYEDYYQGVRAKESYNFTKAVALATEKHFSTNMSYPDKLDDLTSLPDRSLYVGHIDIDKRTGSIKVLLAGNSENEGVLEFVADTSSSGHPTYSCQSTGVPKEYVPEGCTPKTPSEPYR